MKRHVLDIPILVLALLGCIVFWVWLFYIFPEAMNKIVGTLLAAGFAFGLYRSQPLQLSSL